MTRVSRWICSLAVGVWMLSAVVLGQDRPERRDVLGGAFAYPFLTDAEVLIHFTDVHGGVSSGGGPALLRCPGVTGVQVDGARVDAVAVGPDLLRVDLTPGEHDIVLLTRVERGPTAPMPTSGDDVATPEAFRSRSSALKPGDELVVADGVYANWRVEVTAQGEAERPILIRPRTPGGATFRRNTCIHIKGRFVVLKGFRFDHCGPNPAVRLTEASDCRVTQCQFFWCGNPTTTFAHILNVGMGSHRNRVDHCYFTGSKSMSLGQSVRAAEGVGTQNRYDHNIFRDIYRHWINGQENIQLGQDQRGATGAARPVATVEFNLFDHAWGDSEIISNKSSGNTIRHNLAAHCMRSSFMLRGGNDVRFDGNVMMNNSSGLSVMGKRHVIVNNLFLAHPRHGIALYTGSQDGESQVATEGTRIANNTFIDCADGSVSGSQTTDSSPFAPKGNTFENNLFVGRGVLLDTRYLPESTVRRNLFWARGEKVEGDLGEEAIIADPRMEGEGLSIHPARNGPAVDKALPLEAVPRDRWDRPRPSGNAPDIGADEVGAPGPAARVVLPPIPPKPILAADLYMGECLWTQDPNRPLDGWRTGAGVIADADSLALTDAGADLARDLPGDFVVTWEHRPDTFDASAGVTFASDGKSGYVLSWGGAAKDGKPAGVVTLRKLGSEEVIADGADVVYFYQDYRFQRWLDKTRDTRTTPDPRWPYRFTIVKHGGRLIILLNGRYALQPVPIITWEDRGVVGGPRLRIDQRGAGKWCGFRIWRCAYTGDTPPPPPTLTAQPRGGHRVALYWLASSDAWKGCRYDVHRDVKADFTPSAENLVAGRVGGGGYDDLAVAPQTSYWYAVRAYNPLGLPSGFARAEATTGTGGPVYRVIQATEAALTPPMRLSTDDATWRRYVSAPGGGASRDAPPAEGSAEFRVTIAEAGAYALWGLVVAPSSGADSFYVAVDPARGGEYRGWSTGVHLSWTWSRVLGPVALDRGEHVIALKHREPGTRLAALLLTTDAEFVPATRGSTTP